MRRRSSAGDPPPMLGVAAGRQTVGRGDPSSVCSTGRQDREQDREDARERGGQAQRDQSLSVGQRCHALTLPDKPDRRRAARESPKITREYGGHPRVTSLPVNAAPRRCWIGGDSGSRPNGAMGTLIGRGAGSAVAGMLKRRREAERRGWLCCDACRSGPGGGTIRPSPTTACACWSAATVRAACARTRNPGTPGWKTSAPVASSTPRSTARRIRRSTGPNTAAAIWRR